MSKEHFTSRRESLEYRQGIAAFNGEQCDGQCPYPIGHDGRASWMLGWWDSHVIEKVGHVLRKYGESFP